MTIQDQRGFSLVEALVAVALLAALLAILLDFAAAGQRLGRSQPDAADVSQRLRVAAGMIERDLRAAGASVVHGFSGGLTSHLPAVVPARTGLQGADGELTAFADRISILSVPHGGWIGRLMQDLPDPTADIPIDAGAKGCPVAGLCGFVPGARAAIIDRAGLGTGYDIFTVTSASVLLGHSAPNPPLSKVYPASSSVIVPVEQRIYYRDQSNRLMLYDGYKTALPLVDNVVALQFSYFVDPHPATVAPPSDSAGNCVYAAGDPPVPLLQSLGTTTLVEMPLAQFTDGPVCGVAPNRFDGDVLRIRRVRVTMRVQAALDQHRSTGADYANAGTSSSALSSVRDFEVTFHVTPRNLGAVR